MLPEGATFRLNRARFLIACSRPRPEQAASDFLSQMVEEKVILEGRAQETRAPTCRRRFGSSSLPTDLTSRGKIARLPWDGGDKGSFFFFVTVKRASEELSS